MKSFIICALGLLFISCSQNNKLSPTDTSMIVIRSFYKKDNVTLKEHTTADGYNGLIMIQAMVPENIQDVNVEILEEHLNGDVAWVKYNTSYDSKPGVFKLVKVDKEWKVTSKAPRDRGPF